MSQHNDNNYRMANVFVLGSYNAVAAGLVNRQRRHVLNFNLLPCSSGEDSHSSMRATVFTSVFNYI